MISPFPEHILRAPSLAKVIDGYLITLRSEGKSPNTVSYHQWLLGRFLWWCEQEGILQDIEPSRLPTSASSRRPASQTTLQHYYGSLHVLFEWLTSEGLIASNPLDTIKKPKAEQKVVQAFSQEEVKRLLSLCDNKTFLGIRNRAILMLFLDTILGLSELASLGISDIDLERGTVLVKQGKGREQRISTRGIDVKGRCGSS